MAKKKRRMTNDQMIGFVLLLFSLALYFIIIPREVQQPNRVGVGLAPSFFPNIIAFVLAFLSVILFSKAYIVKKNESPQAVRLFNHRVIVTIGLFGVYMLLTLVIGYLLASILMLAAFLLFLGTRNKWVIVLLAITFPLLLNWFFSKIMIIMLPSGVIFD